MKRFTIIAAIAIALGLASCSENHLINDATQLDSVTAHYQARYDAMQGRQFPSEAYLAGLATEQREAMMFLYAYMPLADVADHPSDYYLLNINSALQARQEMPWGKTVPEREFLHFVLPLRVNNENLDSCRQVFYGELKERVQGLSMHDAVLEVNHWCHEKVAYRPSDSRTSSPLASVKTAYGRCGEESTFTVAAMRSVGIPARQVYTPRWAHTDDNHAWVEVWVDGQWYFIGACEPEPVLNLAWFNAPASRGILMHTKVFGSYNGPEEVMYATPRYTEINVIDNYAPAAASVDVSVTDADGKPVDGAKVEFKVYNYAEFYSVATKTTDAQGRTSLTAGRGDMLVWASKDGKFGYKKVSFGNDTKVDIALTGVGNAEFDLDVVPPAENANLPEVTPEQRAENDRRFAQEDSIRHAYEATFYDVEKGLAFANENQLEPAQTIAELLEGSRGNHQVITTFLTSLTDENRAAGIELLQNISAKDLRDVTLDVLNDHLLNSPSCGNAELQGRYVTNPRVTKEMILPYKSFFKAAVPAQQQDEFRADPSRLVAWVADSITVDATCNLGGAPITPIGVWKVRIADKLSRDIFFVSLARAMGIPSRIDPVTGKVQLMTAEGASDVDFETVDQTIAPTGKLVARYKAIKSLDDPKYYSHYSISRLTDSGSLQLLEYAEDGTSTWSQLLKNGLTLDQGSYLLVSGTRLANGGVLSHLVHFDITPGKTTTIDLVMRESLDEVQVIGNFNSEATYKPVDSDEMKSILATTGRGYYVVGVLGVGQEPTSHALRGFIDKAKELEKWGRGMVLLFPSEEQYKKFDPSVFPGLPKTITYGIDIDGSIQQQIIEGMKLKANGSLPVVIIADTFNRVVYVSQGYNTNMDEQMIQVINKL